MDDHEASNVEIANAWIDYTKRCRPVDGRPAPLPDDDPAWWAVDILMEFEFNDPMRALEIAFAIARRSSDEWVLENLGAGPLETLLGRDPTFLDAIKLEAASSSGLLAALGSVWKMPCQMKHGLPCSALLAANLEAAMGRKPTRSGRCDP